MPQRELREHLEHLQGELSRAPTLDPEARKLLAELAENIERRLADEASEDEMPLADQLRAATVRFEEEHPKLTALVGRIADALANLGI